MGAQVLIPCQAVGDPEPVISWLFNGKQITFASDDGDGDYDDDEDSNDHPHGFVSPYTLLPSGALRIEHFDQTDTGDYRCKATNMMGTVLSEPARITMSDPSVALQNDQPPTITTVKSNTAQLQFDHVPEDVSIPLNDSIILHCAAQKGT